MTMIFYAGTLNGSSWSMRAWLALREAGVEFELRMVDIRRPQRYANLAAIAEFSPPGAVPVLVDDQEVIFDSLAIMEYANDLCHGRLLPSDVRLRARARALVAWVHSGMSGLGSSISFEDSFRPPSRALFDSELAETFRVFAIWEAELQRSGGPFLMGAIGLPDFAFAAVVRRLLWLAPALDDYPWVRRWTAALLSYPTVAEWLRDAEALPPIMLD
ncbi:MAG: glutathione S-transferase [Burkholderiales bacterium PBB4]|nr:MAG: glutathione S-transferase [Burkholderiales bacterium PBB4]